MHNGLIATDFQAFKAFSPPKILIVEHQQIKLLLHFKLIIQLIISWFLVEEGGSFALEASVPTSLSAHMTGKLES